MIPPLFVVYALGLHEKLHFTKIVRRVESLVIRKPGMTIQLDGELVPCDEARFEIMKGALLLKV